MTSPRTIAVFTHQLPEQTSEAFGRLLSAARAANVNVRLHEHEARKHAVEPGPGVSVGAPDGDTDLAVVLGGDGTILSALRAFAGRPVPVFAVNYGAIGFLSTIDSDGLDEGLERALEGDYEVLPMPALEFTKGGERHYAINDISFHRRPSSRVAELAYSVGDEQLGRVRCDGLVASTPVGSTGYNLANGGPILAWGVEGFVVSFIAPHTLTARILVVAPSDPLNVLNLSPRESVDVTTDGRTVSILEPDESLQVRFVHDKVLLAQLPGATFYHRFRDKFGRLAY